MEELLTVVANQVALALETVAVVIVAFGALHALVAVLKVLVHGPRATHWGRHIWASFGSSLLGALQFALAADIVRSTISPTWEQIGELAAIAAIRTFLSYFLERDLMEVQRLEAEAEIEPRA
jgi:uncharacterized membrane protein